VSDRTELYRRLPLLEGDRWWLGRAAGSPDGRVLELGAGTGRLTAAFAEAGHHVTAVENDPAMLEELRGRLGGRIEVVEADVVELPAGPPVGLVALPASLLNELPNAEARRSAMAGAARRCRPDGTVALQLLSPWWLVRLPLRSTGRLHPADGSAAIDVAIEADDFDVWRARRRATLTYRFDDGTVLRDELDAAVVTPDELLDDLAAAGLETVTASDDASPGGPDLDHAPWYVVARPR
jgi:SAM-dependent methyltransferase